MSISRQTKYQRTKKGLVTRIYNNQKNNSIVRGNNPPTYSKEELREWLYAQPKFHTIYDNWKRLDYQKEYAPSIDRKDDYIGYTLSNIQLITWSLNNKKGALSRKNGTNNKGSKAVVQLSKDGDFIQEFYSIAEAVRKTEIDRVTIQEVCKNKYGRKSAGGYTWKYKENYNV